MTAIENVAQHECTDRLADIALRATCFDFMVDTKLLTSAQMNKVLKEQHDISEKGDSNMAVIIGLVLYSMQDLDEKQREKFVAEHVACAEEFMEDIEARGLKRSKKLGPFSYAILD